MKKRLLVFITILFLFFSFGCSSMQTKFPSSKEVAEQTFSAYSDISMVFMISQTDTEYIYLISTINGIIALVHVTKAKPHKITKNISLFRCICDSNGETTEW